jgi:protoporphyrinogen/coproporphyrinogen III oxidase
MRFRHIIIGAGISGLALGWYLKKFFGDNQTLTILESSERVGGWIRTHQDRGFLFEEGPRSCRTKGTGKDTLQLVEELGIGHELISASPCSQKRFIYFEGVLQAVPDTIWSFLFSPLMKGLLPSLWKEWRTPPSHLEDESVADFIERRLSKEIAEKLIDPLVSGIYAGDIHKLSLRSCFPDMHRLEQEHGSLVHGALVQRMLRKKNRKDNPSDLIKTHHLTSIFSFKNGMETLVKVLANRLTKEIQLCCPVKQIRCDAEAVLVTLENGRVLKGDRVFLAVSAQVAGRILNHIVPLAAETMAKSSYATVAVVNMGWNKQVLKQEGFGYLVPSSQKQGVLGVVFDSSAFAEQNNQPNQARLTAMIGGMHRPEVDKLSKERLIDIAQSALNHHLGIYSQPEVIRVSIAKQAIPQYEVGHRANLLQMESEVSRASDSRLFLLGSAWRGVAVNDCIAQAKKMAESLRLIPKHFQMSQIY